MNCWFYDSPICVFPQASAFLTKGRAMLITSCSTWETTQTLLYIGLHINCKRFSPLLCWSANNQKSLLCWSANNQKSPAGCPSLARVLKIHPPAKFKKKSLLSFFGFQMTELIFKWVSSHLRGSCLESVSSSWLLSPAFHILHIFNKLSLGMHKADTNLHNLLKFNSKTLLISNRIG